MAFGMGDKHKGARNGHGVDTLIGQGVVIRGDLSFTGGCYVEGRLIGKIRAEEGSQAVITIAEHGQVEGELRAPVVLIDGHVVGDVFAGERVQLGPKARVQGNIHYKVVEMTAGAALTGRLIHADAPLAQLTAPAEPPIALVGGGKRQLGNDGGA